MTTPIRIGTRGSKLALWQANWVKAALQKDHPEIACELVIIKTKGDKILDVPLAKVGGKGLFVKEIEEALLNGRIDLAVHSMKDMPAEIPAGLCIGAVPAREQPQDALVTRSGGGLDTLPQGARVGTSSLRRSAQLRHHRPDIEICGLRGNLDTRLKKLETEALDAIVLAAAGLKRLGYGDRISAVLDEATMLPAVGQGALCVETRADDATIRPLMATIDDAATRTVVTAERAFLHRLEGGCQVPIAGHGRLTEDTLTLTGLVAGLDGQTMIRDQLEAAASEPHRAGIRLADRLLERGAKTLLEELQKDA
ncbi:MAG: hydroxymethylbilane synthase [Desulfosarcinaceae bacterium]|nr:hydroxymethylbilane synthase [Desulfosarcinaceae bacterium]